MDRALMVSLDLFCQESKTTIISLCGVCVSNFRNTGAYYLCRLDPGQIKKEVCTYGLALFFYFREKHEKCADGMKLAEPCLHE